MPLVLRRLELLEKGGLPEPHRIHFVAARGPLAIAAHVLGTTPFLEATGGRARGDRSSALEVFTDTVIAFLKAQLARLREPLGILVLDDLPGMLSPRGFDRMALPYLQRIFDSFAGLVRIYHNDTPCAHLLPRIGQLHCEVWNFSHEMDIAAVRAAVAAHGAPRQRGAARHAGARHAEQVLARSARVRRQGRAGRRVHPLRRRRPVAGHAGREHRRPRQGRPALKAGTGRRQSAGTEGAARKPSGSRGRDAWSRPSSATPVSRQ